MNMLQLPLLKNETKRARCGGRHGWGRESVGKIILKSIFITKSSLVSLVMPSVTLILETTQEIFDQQCKHIFRVHCFLSIRIGSTLSMPLSLTELYHLS